MEQSYSKRKARKGHTCDWCLCKIQVGETYTRGAVFDSGTAWTWKNHSHCEQIATKLKMFEECYGEGLSQEDFAETITDEFLRLKKLNKETDCDWETLPIFEYRIEYVLNYYDL